MIKKRNISTLTIILFFTHILYGQIDSLFYDIKITVKDLKASKAYLGYYYAHETYVVDSAKVDSLTGFMRFSRRKHLLEGMYFISPTSDGDTCCDKIMLDFIVSGWNDFSIKTHLNVPIDSAEISRSVENQAYFEYLKTVNKLKSEISLLEKGVSAGNIISDENLKIYYRKLRMLDHLAPIFIKKYPKTLFSKILANKQTPFVNIYLKNASSVFGAANYKDEQQTLQVLSKKHYWDNFDFRDTRLLRTPIYQSRLRQFIEEVIPPSVDSTKLYCDILLAHTKVSLEYYQATLKWLTQYYENRLQNAEAQLLFEHLIKNYHHRTSSGTSALALADLDKKLASLKGRKIDVTPSVSD